MSDFNKPTNGSGNNGHRPDDRGTSKPSWAKPTGGTPSGNSKPSQGGPTPGQRPNDTSRGGYPTNR